jgi:tRNA nucleotidyltransferase/poly(A) polymerase
MKIKKYKQFLESQSSDMWSIIPDSVKELQLLFKSKGKKLYVVGGAVRDFLTGDKPKDFDLATDATPDEVLEIIGKDYKTNLQGKAFGVVVVFTDDQPEGMEIATFREDVSKGRKPEVKLGATIEDDVKRRDITYNALFFDLETKEIVDLTGGREHLLQGVTQMVGDPMERFEEDSLRILRAFRFASRYGHPLHKDTEMAIKSRKQLQNIDPMSGEMKRISQERIWEEMKKSWTQAKSYKNYLQFFTTFDMWSEVFPSANINTNLIDSKDFVVVIANLFKLENPNGLEKRLVQDYRIESEVASKVVFLIRLLELTPETAFSLYKSKIQCQITDDTILEWIKKLSITNPAIVKFVSYKPTVSTAELISQGFKGKSLGDEINRLEQIQFKQLLTQ